MVNQYEKSKSVLRIPRTGIVRKICELELVDHAVAEIPNDSGPCPLAHRQASPSFLPNQLFNHSYHYLYIKTYVDEPSTLFNESSGIVGSAL